MIRGLKKLQRHDFSLCKHFFFSFFFQISRDPRFDDLSGEYKPEIFNQTYKFINELREKEEQVCENVKCLIDSCLFSLCALHLCPLLFVSDSEEESKESQITS